jgi:hypothetical protein
LPLLHWQWFCLVLRMREAADMAVVDMAVTVVAMGGTVVAMVDTAEVTPISMVEDMAAGIFAGEILPAPAISAGMASIRSDPSRSVPVMCEVR